MPSVIVVCIDQLAASLLHSVKILHQKITIEDVYFQLRLCRRVLELVFYKYKLRNLFIRNFKNT